MTHRRIKSACRAANVAFAALVVLTALTALIPLAGCGRSGPEMYSVKGIVTHKGKPIPKLYLVFRPDDLSKYSESVALTDDSGRFELMVGSTPGVFPGPHKVIAEDPLAVQGAQMSDDPDYIAVCEKYGPESSTYTFTVEKDEPNLELKLD